MTEHELPHIKYHFHTTEIPGQAESFVETHYKEQGYQVHRTTNLIKEGVEGFGHRNKSGCPDFTVFTTPIDYFFVEVKGSTDAVRVNQLEWYKDNMDKQIVLFVLTYIRIPGQRNDMTKKMQFFAPKSQRPIELDGLNLARERRRQEIMQEEKDFLNYIRISTDA